MNLKILDIEYICSKCYQFYLDGEKLEWNETKKFLINSQSKQEYKRLKIVSNNSSHALIDFIEINRIKTLYYMNEITIFGIIIHNEQISIIDGLNSEGFVVCQDVVFILKKDNLYLGLIDEKENINHCEIFKKKVSIETFTIFYKDCCYNFDKEELISIEKCNNQILNTFIGFEDLIRNISQKNKIPFFWKLNYLPAYKKLKQTKKELFEPNIFKSIVEYI
jgi:hypothetical protein